MPSRSLPWPRVAVIVVGCVLAASSLAAAQSDDRQGRINDLVAWVHAAGGDMSTLDVFPSPAGGYGVRATRAIVKGNTFVSVPDALVMNERAAMRSPVTAHMINHLRAAKLNGIRWTDTGSVILQLVYEALYNPMSYWAPYFRLLPTSFHCYRTFFTDAEFEVINEVAAVRESVQRYPSPLELKFMGDSLAQFPLVFGEDTPNRRAKWEAEIKWAFAIVGSRSYSPRFEGDHPTLIPVLDLLNHQNNGSLSSYVASETNLTQPVAFIKVATMDYQPGEEVWASYTGTVTETSCNHKLFGSWGFTLPDPHSQCLAVTMMYQPPEPVTDSAAVVMATLARLNLTIPAANGASYTIRDVVRMSSMRVPTKLLQAFRIINCLPAELSQFHDRVDFASPVSVQSEHLAMRELYKFAALLKENAQSELNAVLARLPADPSLRLPSHGHVLRIAEDQVTAAGYLRRLVEVEWQRLLLL